MTHCNRNWLALLGACGWLAFLPVARAQVRPYIGFVYPAGGQQGTTCQIKLGGQGLDDLNRAFVTGSGVTARVVEYDRTLGPQEITLLNEQLKELERGKPKTASMTTMPSGTVPMAAESPMMTSGTTPAKPAAAPTDRDASTLIGRIEKRVDEAQVRQIVNGIVGERMKEIRSEAMSKVDEYLKNVPPREVLQIKKWDGTVTEIAEQYHKQLPMIVKALTARNASGQSEFLYIWGAAGAGKTFLLCQIAKALGVKHYPYPMGPTATEGKILGFNNIATGSFIKGWLYDPYKNGGLVGLDEIDLADGSVLAGANSIENDEFTFGNGDTVKRHKDFYLIAFANTMGTGATGGFVRNKLDAATLDRFTVIKLDYDEDLEKRIYGNPKWAEYVQKVRHHVAGTMAGSMHITPRATRKGAALLANGFTPMDVCDMTVFRMMSKEQKATCLATVGPYKQ